ncbi:MAG: hypothetical protein JSR82_06900 [Verrucomicrobia bacterium]|nr:hypothetical protein [Verrucomicrobiota bacterium]
MTALYKKRLDAVQGYLELGMFDDALAELAAIEGEFGPRYEVLMLRMMTLRGQQRWGEMREVCSILRETQPERAESWIWLADATRHCRSLGEAREILREAETMFPANPHVKFQLGCYSCQLGELEPAMRYVQEAVALDRRWLRVALSDRDVEPLWEILGFDNR